MNIILFHYLPLCRRAMWLSSSLWFLKQRPHPWTEHRMARSGMSLFRLLINLRRLYISISSELEATSYRSTVLTNYNTLTMIESSSSPKLCSTSSSFEMLSFDQNSLRALLDRIWVMLWSAFAATLDKSMSSMLLSLSTSINLGITFCFCTIFSLVSSCRVIFIIIPTE